MSRPAGTAWWHCMDCGRRRAYPSRGRARQGAMGHAISTGHAVELSPPLESGARRTVRVEIPAPPKPSLLRWLWGCLTGGGR